MSHVAIPTGPLHIDLPTDFTYNPEAHIFGRQENPPGFKHLCMTGARSREAPNDDVVAQIDAVLDCLEAQGLYLTQGGFEQSAPANRAQQRAAGAMLDVRAVQMALADIPLVFCAKVPVHLKEMRLCHAGSSYGLKHHLEHYRKDRDVDPYASGYITNGDFIMAMILSGFTLYRERSKKMPVRNGIFKCCSLMEHIDFVPGYGKKEFRGSYITEPKYDLLDY
jgi:hypothetical protein